MISLFEHSTNQGKFFFAVFDASCVLVNADPELVDAVYIYICISANKDMHLYRRHAYTAQKATIHQVTTMLAISNKCTCNFDFFVYQEAVVWL